MQFSQAFNKELSHAATKVSTGAPAYEALHICTSTLSGASAGIRGHHVSRRLF
jgi:hypothetical protein